MKDKNIFDNLHDALSGAIEELTPVPFSDKPIPEFDTVCFDRTEKSNNNWKALVSKHIITAKTFEIHCWADEKDEIDLALRYGNIKPNDWKHGMVIFGEVTPDFTAMLLNTPKPQDTEIYNKMTPFFSIFFDNGFSSEHYGTENIIYTPPVKG